MSEPEPQSHIIVESGPDRGRQIDVPERGGRVGRAADNDIVLNDPSLSRFHCRLFFGDDGRLWVSDLASTNETLLNHKPVKESALSAGDRIEIGETVLKIVRDRRDPDSGRAPAPQPLRKSATRRRMEADRQRAVLVGIGAVGLILLAVALTSLPQCGRGPEATGAPDPGERALEVSYESVETFEDNIFRYALDIRDGTLALHLTDLAGDQSLSTNINLQAGELQRLADAISQTAFYELSTTYQGLGTEEASSRDLLVIIGRRAHHVHLQNRLMPDAFQAVHDILVDFARSKAGGVAAPLPVEERLTEARAHLEAVQAVFGSDADIPTLAAALPRIDAGIQLLRPLDPPPDLLQTLQQTRGRAEARVQERYDQLMNRADQAIRNREWDAASKHLQTILDLIPDRGDERHARARTRLLDVERHRNSS